GTMRLNAASDNRRRMRGRRVRPRTRSLGDRIAKGALLISKLLPASIQEFGSPRAVDPGGSMRNAAVNRLRGQPVGEHGLAADHALAERDERHVGRRDIDVDARAEADKADALPNSEQLTLIDWTDDAPRHQPGDQHEGDLRHLARGHAECQALVVEARLVEPGGDEPPPGVAPPRDRAADRRARDVD